MAYNIKKNLGRIHIRLIYVSGSKIICLSTKKANMLSL